jgi:hypothetical protein
MVLRRASTCVLLLASLAPGPAPFADAAVVVPSAPGERAETRADEPLLPEVRGTLLAGLAVRRHVEAGLAEAEERALHQRARSLSPAGAASPAAAALTTPRADALRAEAVRLAQQALEEAPGSAELPEALLAGGVDATRIGRPREGLRMLALLIRRFPESAVVGEAWLALGEHHLRAGELTRARAALEQAERTGGAAGRPLAAARLADVSLAAADLDGGLAAAERALAAGGRDDVRPVLERFAAAAARARWAPEARRRLTRLIERAGAAAR